MIIIKDKQYLKSYKKNILNKNLKKEIIRIQNIENLIINSRDLQQLVNSPYKSIYHIEQKKSNLSEFYTARVNNKLRLIMKPIGIYPYNKIEIKEIEFIDIDVKHYGEG